MVYIIVNVLLQCALLNVLADGLQSFFTGWDSNVLSTISLFVYIKQTWQEFLFYYVLCNLWYVLLYTIYISKTVYYSSASVTDKRNSCRNISILKRTINFFFERVKHDSVLTMILLSLISNKLLDKCMRQTNRLVSEVHWSNTNSADCIL